MMNKNKPDKKKNCWEFKHCGRESGGILAEKLGVCPAVLDSSLDGLNSGMNGGRICWLVAGTFCACKSQGTFIHKQKTCKQCDFYQLVRTEEKGIGLIYDKADIYAVSHIGHVREVNEDRYLVKELEDKSLLFAVTDGLGGQVAGDHAAEIMLGKLTAIKSLSLQDEQQFLKNLVEETDRIILFEGEKSSELEGMGTTLLSVILHKNTAAWVHVGDCRLYLLRNKMISQITEDQNLARYLVEEGIITSEEVKNHYSRNILDQCVGCGMCEPETGLLEIQANDLLVLTTDGLHNHVPETTINSILNMPTSLEEKGKSLINSAFAAGSDDNITLILVQTLQHSK